MVTTIKFVSYKGKDFNKTCVFKDSDGNAIDITNYVFNYVLKESPSDSTAVLTKTALTHTSEAGGKFLLAINPADTSSIFISGNSKTFYAQIYGTDPNGETDVWADGTHELKRSLS